MKTMLTGSIIAATMFFTAWSAMVLPLMEKLTQAVGG